MSGPYKTANTFYETPRIDAFAKTGVAFTNAWVSSPVCSPSRYAIITGKHPARAMTTQWFSYPPKSRHSPDFQTALHVNELPAADTTLAEALQQSSFATAYVGKWRVCTDSPAALCRRALSWQHCCGNRHWQQHARTHASIPAHASPLVGAHGHRGTDNVTNTLSAAHVAAPMHRN